MGVFARFLTKALRVIGVRVKEPSSEVVSAARAIQPVADAVRPSGDAKVMVLPLALERADDDGRSWLDGEPKATEMPVRLRLFVGCPNEKVGVDGDRIGWFTCGLELLRLTPALLERKIHAALAEERESHAKIHRVEVRAAKPEETPADMVGKLPGWIVSLTLNVTSQKDEVQKDISKIVALTEVRQPAGVNGRAKLPVRKLFGPMPVDQAVMDALNRGEIPAAVEPKLDGCGFSSDPESPVYRDKDLDRWRVQGHFPKRKDDDKYQRPIEIILVWKTEDGANYLIGLCADPFGFRVRTEESAVLNPLADFEIVE
jgi:hypothetical protein